MLKVNEEKLLLDHAKLIDKRESNLEEITAQATHFAEQRGYDEETKAKFIAYMQGLEGNGLSTEESAKLQLLESYIEEIDDHSADIAEEDILTETSEEGESTTPSIGLVQTI